VTSDDLHAWPELYFAGVGWVAFEPTVGRGTIPSYTRPDTTTTPIGPQTSSTSTAAAKPLVPEDPTNVPNPNASTATSAAQPIASALGIGLLIVAVLLTPAVLRRLRRRNRLRRLTDEWGGAAVAWSELRDTARDLGWSVPVTETPRVFAGRIAQAVAGTDGEPAMGRLLTVRERDAFGPPSRAVAVGLADDLQRVISAFEAQAGWALRAKALLIPGSLIPAGWSPGPTVRGAA